MCKAQTELAAAFHRLVPAADVQDSFDPEELGLRAAAVALGTFALTACGGSEDARPLGATDELAVDPQAAAAASAMARHAAALSSQPAAVNDVFTGTQGDFNFFDGRRVESWSRVIGSKAFAQGSRLDPADMAAARLVLQAGIGATDADIAAVRSKGAQGWLEEQLAMPMSERAYDWLMRTGYAANNEFNFQTWLDPIEFVLSHQAITAPDQVRKRVALALSEFLVVSAVGINAWWVSFVVAHYWDLLNDNAFGSFRKLLEDVTLSAAMGQFLNTRGNLKEDPATGRVPDENYARELMQLFTIGLNRLNPDGTVQRDANGNPIATFSADDVTNLAKVFTGYHFWDDGRREVTFQSLLVPYPEYARRPMVLNPAHHSPSEKRFLGVTIPAGTPAAAALKTALDTLFNHPNVGPFFGRQMIQRLVTSNPSPAYVARVTAAFDDNGQGVRGDLKAVWRAILLDPEARGGDGLSSTTFGKVREPFIRTYQWARTFKVAPKVGHWKLNLPNAAWSPETAFNQRPFFSPSVFNFFRPGYVPPGTALAAAGATAPEFQILNESTVCQWPNFIEGLVQHGPWVTWPDKIGYPRVYEGPYPGDGHHMPPDYSTEIALAHDPVALVRRLNLLLCAGQLSDETQARIIDILTRSVHMSIDGRPEWKRGWVAAAIVLVMCCPEYLIQK